jgi:aminomethyltransferase
MPDKKELLKSPLDAVHRKAKARMIPFGGWDMPVQYEGIIDEHRAVRSAAGLFDISHMGELRVSGPRAESWLNTVLSNDVRQIQPGELQYTLILNDQGGIIDDLIVYRLTDLEYLLVINASRIKEDIAWLESHLTDNVKMENISSETAAVALQGPLMEDILDRAFPEADPLPPPWKNSPLEYLSRCRNLHCPQWLYRRRRGGTLFSRRGGGRNLEYHHRPGKKPRLRTCRPGGP